MNAKVTMERLQMRADGYSAVIQHGDHVLAAMYTSRKGGHHGCTSTVYRLAEQPIDGWGPEARGFIECALEPIAHHDDLFSDAGHAIAWALTQI